MIACTSPLFTVSDSPWRISRSSTRTCRSLTSSNDIILFHLILALRSAEGAYRRAWPTFFPLAHPSRRPLCGLLRMRSLSDRSFQRDRNQFLRLDRELHRELLQHVLDEAVDDKTDGFFLAEPALHAIEQHVLGNLRRRGLVLEGRGRILRLDIGHGVRAAFVADQKRVTGCEVSRAARFAMRRDETAIGVL